MSSIVGLKGKFCGNDIVEMLRVSKNRGLDSSGVYLDRLYEDINLDEFSDDNEYDIAFGHNMMSVYDSNDRISAPQPIVKDNLVLVFDGELYNFKTMKNFLAKVGIEEEITSDAQALLNLICFNLSNQQSA